ncbi:MAG: FG-GAP repeat domain-containing protein [Isosphaeraceae bacterium]
MADAVEADGSPVVTSPGRFAGRLVRLRVRPLRLVAVVIVVELAGLASWWVYDHWRRGTVDLVVAGPPLMVAVLDETGKVPILEPIEVVSSTRLWLADGDYRLRLTGTGRLGQTYRFAVNRGETLHYRISLERDRLLFNDRDPDGRKDPAAEAPPFHPKSAAVEFLPGKADLVTFDRGTLLRRDGATAAVVWDVMQTSDPNGSPRDPGPGIRAIAEEPFRASLVNPPADLNGDGVRDLVWSDRQAPRLLAMSGADGSMLWHYESEPDGQAGPRPPGSLTDIESRQGEPRGQILDEPVWHDVDRDGVPDLIATFLRRRPGVGARNAQTAGTADARPLVRSIAAISGKTGRRLWWAGAPFQTTEGEQPRRADLVRGRNWTLVAFVDGSRWTAVDPATGRPAGPPVELGAVPARPLQYADLDGDGEPELLALMESTSAANPVLAAFSISARRPLWTVPITEPVPPKQQQQAIDWPWLADLDGDGTTTIFVPDVGPMPPIRGYRGVRRLDGRTGRTLWTRPLRPDPGNADGQTRFLEAPDLDGDGVRDLILARLDRPPPGRLPRDDAEGPRLDVDALSGKDGHSLWSWHQGGPNGVYDEVGELAWWGRGPDGWPLLAVPVRNVMSGDDTVRLRPTQTHVLEASTGRERHVAVGLEHPRTADLDGDGVLDLWGEVNGKAVAFRGTAPEAWRALERLDAVAREPENLVSGDLDGDGVGDVLTDQLAYPIQGGWTSTMSRTVLARSGTDGRLLWKSRLDSVWSWLADDNPARYSAAPLGRAGPDLDGDGTTDLLVQDMIRAFQVNSSGRISPGSMPADPLRILSGRTGRSLWSADQTPVPPPRFGKVLIDPQRSLAAVAIRPASRPDLLVDFSNDQAEASGDQFGGRETDGAENRLIRLSRLDGRVVWSVVLGPRGSSAPEQHIDLPSLQVADLDGDGSRDALVFAPPSVTDGSVRSELKAVALADGRVLWSCPLAFVSDYARPIRVAVGDLDDDGRAEVVLAASTTSEADPGMRLVALDGRDGRPRWTWQPAPDDLRPLWWGLTFGLARVRENGGLSVALIHGSERFDWLVLLDARGKEVARRELTGVEYSILRAEDLTGDGRDELIVGSPGEFSVHGPDLRPLWSFADPKAPEANWWTVPATARRPGLVFIEGHPVRNGADGRPIEAVPTTEASVGEPAWLDGGEARRPSLWLVKNVDRTICYESLALTEDGKLAPPRGTPTPRNLARVDDPRWRRRLPWVEPITRQMGLRGLIAMFGLAAVNLAIPLGLLRLAARRRPWTIRLLLALPLAAAVPLFALRAFEPMMPHTIGAVAVSPRRIYLALTMGGAPLVAFAIVAGWSMVRFRWRTLLAMAAVWLVSSAAVEVAWIAYDIRSLPPPGYYDRSGWPLALVPGAGATGIVLIIGSILRRPIRWLMQPRRAASGS